MYPQSQHGQGYGLDPAFLAVQLRKLQKKQKGAVREVQAAAAREAFWRRSSHSAEQALDEVIKPASVIRLLRLILLTLFKMWVWAHARCRLTPHPHCCHPSGNHNMSEMVLGERPAASYDLIVVSVTAGQPHPDDHISGVFLHTALHCCLKCIAAVGNDVCVARTNDEHIVSPQDCKLHRQPTGILLMKELQRMTYPF